VTRFAVRWHARRLSVVGAVSALGWIAPLSTSLLAPFTPATAQRAVASDEGRNRHDATAAADSLLMRRVSVNLDRVPLRSALDLVARSANVHVTYQLELVDSVHKVVTLHARDITLGDAFERLFNGTPLQVLALPDARLGVSHRQTDGAAAQANGNVQVDVTDAKTKRPVAGASVTLDDSVRHGRTDEQGRVIFANVAAGQHRVAVRGVGYTRRTGVVIVHDDSTSSIAIVMDAAINTLDQVVVTATGAQRYRELGHVVATINADSLVKTAPITTLADLLTARVPGLQVATSGGTVGGEIGLRLRGQTTLTLDPQPIVIVDGVRYRSTNTIANSYGDVVHDDRPQQVEGRSPLNDLNVNDIETIDVVKGPSASTLYGPDAANGVIVITTKRGKVGKPDWHFYVHPSLRSSVPDTRLPTGYQAWGHDSASGATFMGNCTLLQQYKYHNCILDSITVSKVNASDANVNVLAPNRPQGQLGASVSGGAGMLRYFLSGNYDSQLGSLTIPARVARLVKQQTGTNVTSLIKTPNSQQSVDVHANLSTDLSDRGTLGLATTVVQSTQRGINVNLFSNAIIAGRVPAGYTGADSVQYLDQYAYAPYYLETSEMQSRRLTGAVNADYKLFPWLTVNGSAGVDMGSSTDVSIAPANTDYVGENGFGLSNGRTMNDRTLTGGATAIAKRGIWSFRTSLGAQYVYSHIDGLNVTASDLAPGSRSLGTAGSSYVTQVWTETVTLGTYGEEVVGLNDRLFLTGSLRVDGAASYGDAYHPRLFPKIGASWIASDEPFLRNTPGLNELRFRVSMGASSRAPTSGMKVGYINSDHVSLEGQNPTIYYLLNLANPNVRPEQTRETEYGADATMLGNRLHLSLTGYRRRINDQLVSFQEPQGLPSAQYINIGDATSSGFETTVTVNVFQAPSWNMDVMLNTDYQTSKLVRLGNVPPGLIGAGYAVGFPLGAVFGRRIIGVTDTVGGHADGIIFPEEVQYSPFGYLGVAYPPHTYTLTPTLTLAHGHLRLSTLFDRQTGFIQGNPYLNSGCADYGTCLTGLVKTSSLLDQARTVSSATDYESGNFTRWREASATIDIPEQLMRRVWMKHGQLSVAVRNLALWTAYNGPDPEANPGAGLLAYPPNNTAIGIPNPRTWTIRFDINP